MAIHRITLTDADLASHRKMTANEVLVNYAIPEGRQPRSAVMQLRYPVQILTVSKDEHTKTRHKAKLSPQFFRLLETFAQEGEMIVSLSWRGAKLGPHGLYTLNAALRTHAVRRGGLNIVRHWLKEMDCDLCPLRSKFNELLDYLEIRPVFTNKSAPVLQNARYYV